MKLFDAASHLLSKAIKLHKPKYIIALFSGGHDSLVATHIASKNTLFSFALHINTGIGIPETQQYVESTCASLGIALKEYQAAKYRNAKAQLDPQRYSDLVKERGFPGPPMHTKMYNRLKERPLRQAIRELDRIRTDRVLLVTGLRSQESARRMRHVQPTQIWEGTKIWVAPIWKFTKLDVNNYIQTHQLPRNLVVDLIHKSGECLCGAFAKPGEKEELRLWFPKVAARLDRLELDVRANGFDWGWGERPKKTQQREPNRIQEMLCSSCLLQKAGL